MRETLDRRRASDLLAGARSLFELFRAAFADFQHDKCTHLAAGVAYYVLLSIFPLFIFAVSMLGVVLQDDSRREEFIDDLISALPLEAVEQAEGGEAPQGAGSMTELERNLRDAVDGVQGFSFVGLLGLAGTLWAASGMFAAIRNALDLAWDVEEPGRGFVKKKLVDFAMIGGIGLLFVSSIALTTLVAVVRNVADFPAELAVLWQLAGTAISLALTFAAVMVLFRFVPDTNEPTLRTIWPGALVGALGFEALKFGFSIYVENFGNYNEVYGTIGTVVVFLFWAWLLTVIVLFGAELSAEYGRRKRGLPSRALHAVTG